MVRRCAVSLSLTTVHVLAVSRLAVLSCFAVVLALDAAHVFCCLSRVWHCARAAQVSDDARSFISQALKKHPGDRPTVVEMLDHAWISKFQVGMPVGHQVFLAEREAWLETT